MSWVTLTPEEWVRQNFARYLTEEKNFPVSRVGIEHSIYFNQKIFRADIIIFGKSGEPLIVVECKAPEVKISQQVFDQIVRYNIKLRVKYLIVSNGLNHYCCFINLEDLTWSFLAEIPDYRELEG